MATLTVVAWTPEQVAVAEKQPGITNNVTLLEQGGNGAPSARRVVNRMGYSKLLGKVPVVSDGPSMQSDAFAQASTIFVLNKQSPKFGIWGQSATSNVDTQNAVNAGDRIPLGYSTRLYTEIPSGKILADILRDSQGDGLAQGFYPKFEEDLRAYDVRIWRDFVIAQGRPDPMTGSSEGGVTPMLPPGLDAGGSPAVSPEQDKTPYEFSVDAEQGGYFTARTPANSARGNKLNPHKGISIINPGTSERLYPGQTFEDATPDLDEYREAGWTGLSRYILAYQADTNTATTAEEELSEAMDAAMDGDDDSAKALKAVGVVFKGKRRLSQVLESGEDFLEGLFGS